MTEQLYRFVWGNNYKRASLCGRTCRILKVGKKNTVLVEFADNGQQEAISRRALRRIEK